MKCSFSGTYGGINVTVDFSNKFNIIRQNSGSGKTFLFKILGELCEEQGKKCCYLDYQAANYSITTLISICNDFDIVCLDNADLYLNQEIMSELMKLDVQVIMSLKSSRNIEDNNEYFGYYTVSYIEDSIVTRRVS